MFDCLGQVEIYWLGRKIIDEEENGSVDIVWKKKNFRQTLLVLENQILYDGCSKEKWITKFSFTGAPYSDKEKFTRTD